VSTLSTTSVKPSSQTVGFALLLGIAAGVLAVALDVKIVAAVFFGVIFLAGVLTTVYHLFALKKAQA